MVRLLYLTIGECKIILWWVHVLHPKSSCDCLIYHFLSKYLCTLWYPSPAEKPSVLKRPESFIVGLQNATTSPPTFTCTVGGAPEPRLYWTYIPGLDDDRPVHLFNNGEKYNIIWNTTKQTNGLFVVTSTVTFLSVTNTDGGIVRCNTGPDSDPAYADALLTVLGMHVTVLITECGSLRELIVVLLLQHCL